MTHFDAEELIKQLTSLDHKLDVFAADMRHELGVIKDEVSETRDIVKAWEAIKTGGKFLTWFGALLAAIGVIGITLKSSLAFVWGK